MFKTFTGSRIAILFDVVITKFMRTIFLLNPVLVRTVFFSSIYQNFAYTNFSVLVTLFFTNFFAIGWMTIVCLMETVWPASFHFRIVIIQAFKIKHRVLSKVLQRITTGRCLPFRCPIKLCSQRLHFYTIFCTFTTLLTRTCSWHNVPTRITTSFCKGYSTLFRLLFIYNCIMNLIAFLLTFMSTPHPSGRRFENLSILNKINFCPSVGKGVRCASFDIIPMLTKYWVLQIFFQALQDDYADLLRKRFFYIRIVPVEMKEDYLQATVFKRLYQGNHVSM